MPKQKVDLELVQTKKGVYLNGMEGKWKDKMIEAGAKETKLGNLHLPANVKTIIEATELVETTIGTSLYKYAALVAGKAASKQKEAESTVQNNFVLKQNGTTVEMNNPDFVENSTLKNAFKQVIKDAELTMKWVGGKNIENKHFDILDTTVAKVDKLAQKAIGIAEKEHIKATKESDLSVEERFNKLEKEIKDLKSEVKQKLK